MEPFIRQLKRAALLALMGTTTLLVVDSLDTGHKFHEAHLLPFDISVFFVASGIAMLLVPFRPRKPGR